MYKSVEQALETAKSISEQKEHFYCSDPLTIPTLHRQLHVEYLLSALENGLSKDYISLDSSHPWICFWICQSLYLLGVQLTMKQKQKVFLSLSQCKCSNGGFSGSPTVKFPHLASTYAAVATIAILAEPSFYQLLQDRKEISAFLLSLKNSDGSWSMHEDGESDARAVYCALATAYLCALPLEELAARETVSFLASCQNWDGGIGPQPGVESHGGYSYCAYASLCILRQTSAIDEMRLLQWAVARQNRELGGFQGRTGKLVDGCYSFWLGGLFELLAKFGGFYLSSERNSSEQRADNLLFDQYSLQEFLLVCCQSEDEGGMKDKPDTCPDLYHTCYDLAGLAAAQSGKKFVLGEIGNLVEKNDALLNVGENLVQKQRDFLLR
jgi:protein farnesyltransferase subunit beta